MPFKRDLSNRKEPSSKRTCLELDSLINKTFRDLNSRSLNLLEQSLPPLISLADCTRLLREINRTKNLADFPEIKPILMRVFSDLNSGLANQNEMRLWLRDRAASAKNIGFLLYNLGSLANAQYRKDTLFPNLPHLVVSSLTSLLNQLNCPNISGKIIANSLQGLGLLAEAKKIDGRIPGETLLPLLQELLKRPDHLTRDISNSLYALGRLVENKNLQGQIDSADLIPLLEALLECPDNEQHISNSLHALGRLAENKKLLGEISSAVLIPLLKTLLKFQYINAQGISKSLYALVRLADNKNLQGQIDSADLIPLLSALLECPDNEQHISNSLYALGRLAENEKLQGEIQSAIFIPLLQALHKHTHINDQSISNSLHALGRLAEKEKLLGEIETAELVPLLLALLKCPNNEQHISNSLYALGRLAESKKLLGEMESADLSPLLKALLQCPHISAQGIGNSIYALGRLAENKKLLGEITTADLRPLLEALPEYCNTQIISNSLKGLGRLAGNNNLQGDIRSETLLPLLESLLDSPNTESQHISNSLYGLGYLAENEKLLGEIRNETLISLLNALLKYQNIESHSISNSLYALGRLAGNKSFSGQIGSETLIPLLEALLECPNIDSPHISNSLWALSRLADVNKLSCEIGSDLLLSLLECLTKCTDIDDQAITNSIYALGQLTLYRKISGNNHFSFSFSSLLDKTVDLFPIHNRQILAGLTAMIEQDFPAEQALTVSQLEQRMDLALMGSYLHPISAAKLIHSLTLFNYSSPKLNQAFETLLDALKSLNFQHLPIWLQTQLNADAEALRSSPAWQQALKNYIKPEAPISLEPNPLLMNEGQLIEALEAPPPAQEEGETVVNPSQENGLLRRQRSRDRRPREAPAERRPLSGIPASATRRTQARVNLVNNVHQEVWLTACQNPIFNAIAQNDINELCRLLQVAQPLSLRGRITTSSHHRRQATTENQRHTRQSAATNSAAAENVIGFLTTTNAAALRQLINQSSSKYFAVLLRVLKQHELYQLAKQENHPFHPIFLYLPLDELKLWIEVVISPFQIYRDSHALLAALDALTLRFHQQANEQESLLALQNQLIDRGLEFHAECNHHHVLHILVPEKRRINNPSLLDNDLVADSSSGGNTVSLRSGQASTASERPNPPRPQPPIRVEAAAPTPLQAASPKNEYYYTSEDINRLLCLRLGTDQNEYPNVHILAAVCLNDSSARNRLGDILQQFIRANPSLPPNITQTLVIPIQIGEHWVGLNLSLEQGIISKAIYYNSLRSEGDQNRLDIIYKEIKDNGYAGEHLNIALSRNEIQQPDATSCGPFLVENLVQDVRKRGWQRPANERERNKLRDKIRKYHWDMLNDKDPQYFLNFQNQENTVLPLSRQLHAANQNAFFSSTSRVPQNRANNAGQAHRP